jgi:hypothetical protein
LCQADIHGFEEFGDGAAIFAQRPLQDDPAHVRRGLVAFLNSTRA